MNEFTVGERYQLHPCTDRWMQGDRYGECVKITTRDGQQRIHLKMDRSGQVASLAPSNVLPEAV